MARRKAWLGALAAAVVAAALAGCLLFVRRDAAVDTSVAMKAVAVYKEGGRWFADVPQHSQAENEMVAGADALLDAFAQGGRRVAVTLSADVASPGAWRLHLHLVEHDRFGATYRVAVAGQEETRLVWLCNVMHTVFGGEHPVDVYIHSVEAE